MLEKEEEFFKMIKDLYELYRYAKELKICIIDKVLKLQSKVEEYMNLSHREDEILFLEEFNKEKSKLLRKIKNTHQKRLNAKLLQC